MKLSLCTGAALLLCSTAVPLAAPDSCERVKSDIQQKIINNGVPETAFSPPLCQTIRQTARVQVVGHCANDTFKITYTRNSDSPAENDAQ